jgi:hypothetical protein
MYVIVTTVQTFRHRYCIPVEELRRLNLEVEATNSDLLNWARDEVTMEEVKEFSQEHLGEQIIDSRIMTQEETLKLFDEDNVYLQGWTPEQKIRYLDSWQDNRA